VVPEEFRKNVLKECSNYIKIKNKKVENTFILSSWLPEEKKLKTGIPYLVSYNNEDKIEGIKGTVTNLEAHPHLSFWNLFLSNLINLIYQGKDSIYFSGSYCTPGNGHDLSFLSGLVVAEEIGASYPFPENKLALKDKNSLKKMLFI
jgi:predicted NAD/FAD-binding protein